MSLVALDTDLSADDARELVGRVRQLTEVTWAAVVKLYKGRGWLALGYSTWDECCDAEFDGARIKLPREQRQEVVASLADEGMSTRAIAAVTGDSHMTVARDLKPAGVTNETPAPVAAPSPASEVEQPAGGASPTPPPAEPELKLGPPPTPATDEQFTIVDDEVVDAEVVEETPAPERTVQGVDGKAYTVTPKPRLTDEEQRKVDDREADGRYARNIQRVISSWPYLLGALDHPRREHIVAQLTESDRDQFAAIEGMLQ